MEETVGRELPPFKEDTDPETILRSGFRVAGGEVKLACSFSAEDVAVVDLIREAQLPIGVFAIDTGRLPEETYEVAATLAERFGIDIEWYFPAREAVEELLHSKGTLSFRSSLANRLECCRIRKVEPLERALSGLSGWVTGLRREQAPTRMETAPLETDGVNGGIVKINPIVSWSWEKVRGYVEARRLPFNRLYHRGYISIGCAPCTRAVAPGEDLRNGRWWWESAEHKECGLHRR